MKTGPWQSANFRWLMGGGLLSMLGDQFTLLAFPWLMLKLTGDAMAMASLVALMSLPRAVFILVGGALVDRYSPKAVLMGTKYVNTVLLAVLALMVEFDALALPAVYALALAIGLASAFSIPSGTAMLPRCLPPQQLQAANSLMMGMRQVSMLAGPVLAGLLIAFAGSGGHPGAVQDARGLSLAFAFDALTFAVSAWTLAQVRPHARPVGAPEQLWRAVGAGLRMVWDDRPLRTCFLYWGLMACVVGGSFQLALPLLASAHNGGASALGLMLGAHGCGILLGMLASGMFPRLRIANLGTTLLVFDMLAGLLVLPLGHLHGLWQIVTILLALGALSGYMQVATFTWIQRRVPPAMLGRTMGLFMFIFMGLAPMASVLSAAVVAATSMQTLFLAAGVCLIAGALLAYVFTPIRAVRDPE